MGNKLVATDTAGRSAAVPPTTHASGQMCRRPRCERKPHVRSRSRYPEAFGGCSGLCRGWHYQCCLADSRKRQAQGGTRGFALRRQRLAAGCLGFVHRWRGRAGRCAHRRGTQVRRPCAGNQARRLDDTCRCRAIRVSPRNWKPRPARARRSCCSVAAASARRPPPKQRPRPGSPTYSTYSKDSRVISTSSSGAAPSMAGAIRACRGCRTEFTNDSGRTACPNGSKIMPIPSATPR